MNTKEFQRFIAFRCRILILYLDLSILHTVSNILRKDNTISHLQKLQIVNLLLFYRT